MQTIEFNPLIAEAAAEVLESMCFTTVAGDVTDTVLPDEGWISVKLQFHGPLSGELGISAPPATAITLGSNFLGEDPSTIDSSQCFEFLGELSNMICGSLLARCGNDGVYSLTHPSRDSYAPCGESNATFKTLQLDEGELYIWLNWKETA